MSDIAIKKTLNLDNWAFGIFPSVSGNRKVVALFGDVKESGSKLLGSSPIVSLDLNHMVAISSSGTEYLLGTHDWGMESFYPNPNKTLENPEYPVEVPARALKDAIRKYFK